MKGRGQRRPAPVSTEVVEAPPREAPRLVVALERRPVTADQGKARPATSPRLVLALSKKPVGGPTEGAGR